MSDDIPPACADDRGHAWVGGEGELDDEVGQIVVVTRRCRRCGYVDDFEEAER